MRLVYAKRHFSSVKYFGRARSPRWWGPWASGFEMGFSKSDVSCTRNARFCNPCIQKKNGVVPPLLKKLVFFDDGITLSVFFALLGFAPGALVYANLKAIF